MKRLHGKRKMAKAITFSASTDEKIFQEHEHIGAEYLRLAFCKDTDTLKEAGERLQSLKPFLKS